MKISIQEDMYEVMAALPEGQGARLAEALVAFGFTGQEPEACTDAWYFAFLAFRSRIELSAKQSAGGEAGNARRWPQKQKEAAEGVPGDREESCGETDAAEESCTEEEAASVPTDTDNRYTEHTDSRYAADTDGPENESEKESESEKEKDSARAAVRAATQEVVGHLNRTCGTSYRTSSASTQRLVSGRLSEGFTAADMCDVIDAKAAQWLSDRRMRGYLRPETLLAASKFEGYLQEARRMLLSPPSMEAYDQAGMVEVVGG